MKPKVTSQLRRWSGEFGKKYTDRNTFRISEFDKIYLRQYGFSRTQMNKEFLCPLKKQLNNILEVGCNIGMQLALLQKIGFDNLYGIDFQRYAVEKANRLTRHINIIHGSAFDIPFKDNFFDLVFTSGVLIHISPKDINKVLDEIFRVSKKFIWGFEYCAENYSEVEYRGFNKMLWKSDFRRLYLKRFKNLKLIKEKKYNYLANSNVDSMFLLKKD